MQVKGVREIAVLSRTQKLIVRSGAVSVINAGPIGPVGFPGEPGPGSEIFTGNGDPNAGKNQVFGIWWGLTIPSYGTLRLSFGGYETVDIPFDANVSVWVSALEALPSIGSGNVQSASIGTELLAPSNEVDIEFSGTLGNSPQEAPTISNNSTDGDLICLTWGPTGKHPVDGELGDRYQNLDVPEGWECIYPISSPGLHDAGWVKAWPNAGPPGANGQDGVDGAQGAQGEGAIPLSMFQSAPFVVDASAVFTTWGNVAGAVAIPPFVVPSSGRLKCTIWGYLKGGGTPGVVYFLLCDYATGALKLGPTVAVPVAAGEKKTFCTAILVEGLTPGETTPYLNIQVMASVAGITWRSYDPGGTRNPDVAPNLVNDGGPTVIQLEVA